MIIDDDEGNTINSRDLAALPVASQSVEIYPGLEVSAYRAPDGAIVIQIDGAPDDDPDCERVRVYLNDGRATEWVGPEG